METSLVRTLLVATSAVLCVASSAFAKDRPRRPTIQSAPVIQSDRWSGFYAGLVAGGANGHSAASNFIDCSFLGFLCDPTHYPENGALLGATASGSKSQVAFTGGVLAGYNWRNNRFVYGVETDVSYLHLRLTSGGSAASLNPGLNNGAGFPVIATVGTTADVDWLATFRGRIGYLASPNLLVYATGGLALTNQSVSYSYTDNWIFNGGALGYSRVSSIASGYAVGGGAEWLFGGSWILRAEYLRVSFGAQATSGSIYVVQVPAARNPYTSAAELRADLFRAGLIYKF